MSVATKLFMLCGLLFVQCILQGCDDDNSGTDGNADAKNGTDGNADAKSVVCDKEALKQCTDTEDQKLTSAPDDCAAHDAFASCYKNCCSDDAVKATTAYYVEAANDLHSCTIADPCA